MIKTTFSLTSHLLCRSVLIPVSCSMMLNASSVAADDDPPGLKPADPAIAQYFKRRDNFNDFKQRREEFYRQMKDVEALVEETPETNAGESLSDSRKARIAAMKQRFEERAQKRQERRGRLANRVKPSETLFRERYAEIQKKLEAYRNASNSSDRRASLAALKEELQALKKEPKQRQNSYQKEVINDNEDATRKPDPTKLKHFRDNLQVLPDALKTSSLVEEEESWSLQNMAQRSLFTILNTLIPTASAADYRRPEPGSGVQACYANGSAHQANIAADLDIAQPELALDPETYAMVTALAAELNYSPVKIYEYVINSFDYEVYLGSVKGVKGMLESGAGNDVDHASLLIALLRASGIPARYTANLAIIEDKPAHNNWHRAESFKANWAMRGKGAREAYPFMTSDSESVSEFDAINGVDIFYSAQAQVTACVPANNYHGAIGS